MITLAKNDHLAEATSALLTTKLHIPLLRTKVVSRARLFVPLDEGFTRRLTLLASPPGFGKTTLLADWVAQRNLRARTAWLSLDAGDDDPARFWAYVLAALERLQPGIGDQALALLSTREAHALEGILTGLINAMAAWSTDHVLILDDYHVIDNPQIHAAMTFLIRHAPAQLHIVLSARADPPLPLAGWRAGGELSEIRAADLRFTSDEARQFLAVAPGLKLTRAEAAALESRTEGWVAGLYLAGLALRGQDAVRVPGFIAAATSSNRFVVDYFVEEILSSQSAEVQDFLRQTSILERLSAPLCDALTGCADSQQILDELERSGIFVLALDSERRWYRYHHLFAAVLRKLLEQTTPDLLPDLHCRAAHWLAQHELIAEAIPQALAAADFGHAVALLERVGMDTLRRGEVETLLHWLAALPPELRRLRPRLNLYEAGALMMAGRFDEVEPLLESAEHALAAGTAGALTGELETLLAAMRATLAVRAGEVSRAVEFTRQALDCLPEDPAGITGLRSWIRGLAYVFASETAEAGRVLSEAISASQAAGDTCMVALETYAYGLLTLTRGHLRQASAAYQRAFVLLAERGEHDAPVAGLVHLGTGELCRMQGDMAAAEVHLAKGLRLVRQLSNTGALAQGYTSLAWLRYAQHDGRAAHAILDEAGEVTQQAQDSLAQALLRAARARLSLLEGDTQVVAGWAAEYETRRGARLADAERLMLGQNEELTWALWCIARGHPEQALQALVSLWSEAEIEDWPGLSVHSRVLMALAWQSSGVMEQALAVLGDALVLAEPEGHIRLFADYGAPMARLLAEGKERSSWPRPRVLRYVTRLLAACEMGEQPPAHVAARHSLLAAAAGAAATAGVEDNHPPAGQIVPLLDILSDRELEVLGLLAAGLSNQAIAERLYLSVATVKSHAHHIYGKLGVTGRRNAQARALELGLL